MYDLQQVVLEDSRALDRNITNIALTSIRLTTAYMSLRVAHKGRRDAAKVGAMPRQCPGGLPWRAAQPTRTGSSYEQWPHFRCYFRLSTNQKRIQADASRCFWCSVALWLVLLLARAAIAQSGLASFMVIKLAELLPGLIRTLSICTAPFPTIVFCKQQRKRGACARNMTACGHGA